MIAYTNYPLFENEYGATGPVRKVEIIDYDGNKYCDILFNGVQYDVKQGYLWRNRRRVCFKHETLCRHFNRIP